MSDRKTDRRAIRLALHIAIDTEDSLIDAHRNRDGSIPEDDESVILARKNIAAFKRVLQRYFNESGDEMRPKAGRPIALKDIWDD